MSSTLLKPEVLARFSTLELVARAVVDGVFTGLHRSPYFGFSQEFAEYRAYNEGDDLRFVDWNVFARTDRTYIKRYLGDTNTQLVIILDASASMAYQSGQVSKIDYAKYLAASLAYLAKRQHDAVGMMIFDEKVRHQLPPSSRPDALSRLLHLLEQTQAMESTEFAAAIEKTSQQISKRGLIALISDLYTEVDSLFEKIRPLISKGQDCVLFHLLDPAEYKPEIDTMSALQDMETGNIINVTPEYFSRSYRQKLDNHISELQSAAARENADYVAINTNEPLEQALHRYLLFRQRRR